MSNFRNGFYAYFKGELLALAGLGLVTLLIYLFTLIL